MKAKDLRIGNYVEVDGMMLRVVSISNNGETHIEVKTPQNKKMEVAINEIKPIPLADDMLISNCQFDENGMHTIGLDEHRYYLKIQDGYIVLLNQQEDPLIHFWDVRYLHSLQNLYHALKGKEMEITIK
jgi:hypothetical protein